MNWDDVDRMWRERHDATQLEALHAALQQRRKASGADYGLHWRHARLLHFEAMRAEEDARQAGDARFGCAVAERNFAAGAASAGHAVRQERYEVEGHFWFGVNSIELARRRGSIVALYSLPRASWHIERAMNIDEAYHFAGPLRVWGRLMHLKPLLLGGSVNRAIDIYRRAMQIVPDNSTTLLYYAEALLADQQIRSARQTLHRILKSPDDPDWLWEQARDRRLAQTLLHSLDN